MLGKMLCIKMLQASDGTLLPLQVYVCSAEVTIELPGKVLPIGRHKLT